MAGVYIGHLHIIVLWGKCGRLNRDHICGAGVLLDCHHEHKTIASPLLHQKEYFIERQVSCGGKMGRVAEERKGEEKWKREKVERENKCLEMQVSRIKKNLFPRFQCKACLNLTLKYLVYKNNISNVGNRNY